MRGLKRNIVTEHLVIDPGLWVGDDLDARLRAHFVDLSTPQGLRDFMANRADRDPTAAVTGWRRIYDRFGNPVLVAVVTWKGSERQWRFPLLSTFVAPDDDQTYLAFDAALPRIGRAGQGVRPLASR